MNRWRLIQQKALGVLLCGGLVASGCASDPEQTTPVDVVKVRDEAPPPEEDYDGDGVTEVDGDCDDWNADVFPGATERCNGEDDDCDEVADNNAVDMVSWMLDADGDGFGTPASTTYACRQPEGYGFPGRDDCDDTDFFVNPDATELCNGVDDDCNDVIDQDGPDCLIVDIPTAFDGEPVPIDEDEDGAPVNHDCDDNDPARRPGTEDIPGDGIDQDCDGVDVPL